MNWKAIRQELLRKKANNLPVETPLRHIRNWIDDVGDDYVIVRSEITNNPRKIASA